MSPNSPTTTFQSARWRGFLRRFVRGTKGSATVEFVLLLPAFLLLFFSTFELGMLMTRHVMLDRGVDLAVREVRLGVMPEVNHENLVRAICRGVVVMENCEADLMLEMRRVDPRGGPITTSEDDCIDHKESGDPTLGFTPGVSNDLMILRVCALFDPFFPTTGLGASLPKQAGGTIGLLATASYVVEP